MLKFGEKDHKFGEKTLNLQINMCLMRFFVAILLLLFVILPIRSATKRALLIGISEYPVNKTVKDASWQPIHGANDIDVIGKTLKAQDFKIALLTNKDATALKIRKEFNKLLSNASSGDLIYIHFSCHGQPVEDLNGDEQDGWDEAIVPYDAWKIPIKGVYDGNNHIIDDELNSVIGKIRKKVGVSGFVYVVIDACHAGGIDRGEEEEYLRGTKSGFSLSNKNYVPRMDARSNIPIEHVNGWANVCMLEACRAYQSNYEIKQDGTYYGPLSYYVNQVLQQQSLTRDTKWVESVKQLMERNPKLLKQNMVIQTTLRK